jgi:hypothetical protein
MQHCQGLSHSQHSHSSGNSTPGPSISLSTFGEVGFFDQLPLSLPSLPLFLAYHELSLEIVCLVCAMTKDVVEQCTGFDKTMACD